MADAVKGLFGGKAPKRDKRLEAVQRRSMQDANNDRAELEAEKADIAGVGKRGRSGRRLLTYVRTRGKSNLGGS